MSRGSITMFAPVVARGERVEERVHAVSGPGDCITLLAAAAIVVSAERGSPVAPGAVHAAGSTSRSLGCEPMSESSIHKSTLLARGNLSKVCLLGFRANSTRSAATWTSSTLAPPVTDGRSPSDEVVVAGVSSVVADDAVTSSSLPHACTATARTKSRPTTVGRRARAGLTDRLCPLWRGRRAGQGLSPGKRGFHGCVTGSLVRTYARERALANSRPRLLHATPIRRVAGATQ